MSHSPLDIVNASNRDLNLEIAPRPLSDEQFRIIRARAMEWKLIVPDALNLEAAQELVIDMRRAVLQMVAAASVDASGVTPWADRPGLFRRLWRWLFG